MKTWEDIRKELQEQPDPRFVKPPDPDHGIKGAYLEGSYVIAVLNEVFGTEGWGAIGQQAMRKEEGEANNLKWAKYSCAGSYAFCGMNDKEVVTVIKADIGNCTAQAKAALTPQQLETAEKGSETDLIKRCARQLGPKSGLWLYFDEKEASALFLGKEDKPDPRTGTQEPEPQRHPSDEDDTIPMVFPGKYGNSKLGKPEFMQSVADACNERGKIPANVLVELVGENAFGYLKWVVDHNKFDTGQYATQNKKLAADVEAWLAKHAPIEEPLPEGMSVRKQIVTLLQGAQDDALITLPVVGPLNKMLATAGYENAFAVNGLIRKFSNDEHLTLPGLTVKRAKALTGYLAYLVDNDPKSKTVKEFAHAVLAMAWSNNVGWKDACDLMANLQSPDLDLLCKAINTALTWADVEPLLVGQGWPNPVPQEKAAKFLQVCAEKGYQIMDKNATLFAKALAQGEGWTK